MAMNRCTVQAELSSQFFQGGREAVFILEASEADENFELATGQEGATHGSGTDLEKEDGKQQECDQAGGFKFLRVRGQRAWFLGGMHGFCFGVRGNVWTLLGSAGLGGGLPPFRDLFGFCWVTTSNLLSFAVICCFSEG